MTTMIAKPVHSREVNDDTDGDMFPMEDGSFVTTPTRIDGSSSRASDVVSTRIDGADVPDWVYRRFSSSNWAEGSPAARFRRKPSQRTAKRIASVPALEPAVSDLVQVALTRSGYPLQHVRCWCDDQTLTLSGFVTRYYYAQIALEAALVLANGRRIEVHIQVIPAPERSLSADD